MRVAIRPLILMLTSASWWLNATPATALTSGNLSFTFFQDGFSEEAVVTGAFSGEDLDGNGILVHFPLRGNGDEPPIEHLELTAWSMHFSGNALSPAFDLALSDLLGFVYQLGTSGLGDDPAFDPTLNQNLMEGIGAIGEDRFYTSGQGPNNMVGGFVGGHIELADVTNLADHALDESANLVRVTLVPEVAGLGMSIAAGLSVAAVGRARRSPVRSRDMASL